MNRVNGKTVLFTTRRIQIDLQLLCIKTRGPNSYQDISTLKKVVQVRYETDYGNKIPKSLIVAINCGGGLILRSTIYFFKVTPRIRPPARLSPTEPMIKTPKFGEFSSSIHVGLQQGILNKRPEAK